MGTIFCATRLEMSRTTTKTLTSSSKCRKPLRRVSFPVSFWMKVGDMDEVLGSILVGMVVSALLERLHKLRALAGQSLEVLFGFVREFNKLDSYSVLLAIAHNADGADLSIFNIDGQLKASACGQAAGSLDEASAQTYVGAHAPAWCAAHRRPHPCAGANRLTLRIATLGAVFEVADAIGILFGFVDALRGEAIDGVLRKADAPVGRDVSLNLNPDMADQRSIVPAYPHDGAAVLLPCNRKTDGLARLEIVLYARNLSARLADFFGHRGGGERLFHAVHSK